MRARATQLEYLKWFYSNADFGPADSDVRNILKRDFMEDTGKNLPEGFNLSSDGETVLDLE